MIQHTSIDAYHKIEADGLLSRRRWEVYDYIFKLQPCSIGDILAGLARQGQNTGTYSGRISELLALGVIEPWGEKVDHRTGHSVILWHTTGNLPGALPKKETKTQAIARLMKENQELRRQLAAVPA